MSLLISTFFYESNLVGMVVTFEIFPNCIDAAYGIPLHNKFTACCEKGPLNSLVIVAGSLAENGLPPDTYNKVTSTPLRLGSALGSYRSWSAFGDRIHDLVPTWSRDHAFSWSLLPSNDVITHVPSTLGAAYQYYRVRAWNLDKS